MLPRIRKSVIGIVSGLSLGAGVVLAWVGGASCEAATPKPAPVVLTADGQKLMASYAAMLAELRATIAQALPKIDAQKQSAYTKALEAEKAAEAGVKAAQQPLDKIGQAVALVGHAHWWIGSAEQEIAAAQAQLKQATTEAARQAAQKTVAQQQARREAGIKALQEREESLAKLKVDEPMLTQALEAAKQKLVRAQAATMQAMAALGLDPFLTSDKLDAQLVPCAVLTEATPRGLAEFAQQGAAQQALVEKLLGDRGLMKRMLEAGGAKGGKYGQAMTIYTDIQRASPRAGEGLLARLALGVSLELAVPVKQSNPVAEKNAPAVVDPVKRYLHYEKAYLDGALDPAFKNMTAWEYRYITRSRAPDRILAWGRQMLRNYRPDLIATSDYEYRYSRLVRTDVRYRHSYTYQDTDTLDFYQNILKNGGICGRRAFFGEFIVQAFGLPAVFLAQHAHAALGRWTPDGWVTNLGPGWPWSWFDGRTGLDFTLEAQARKNPQAYLKVLRAQWVGDALGEQQYNSFKENGGWWNVLARYEEKAIVARTNPAQLTELGQRGVADEAKWNKAVASEPQTPTAADRKIVFGAGGVITLPAVACDQPRHSTGAILFMNSFGQGMQLLYSCSDRPEPLDYSFDVPAGGKYTLVARVVTVSADQQLQVAVNGAGHPVDIAVPYTLGRWQQTAPVEINLVPGANRLRFSGKTDCRVTIREFTLMPVH